MTKPRKGFREQEGCGKYPCQAPLIWGMVPEEA